MAEHEHPPVERRVWYQPMTPRRTDEAHRTATPLELFYDLCFVVAVAIASGELHHEVAEGHFGNGVLSYCMVFFAIWWSWMNFTWFASAFDVDDGLYRLMTFIQMGGVLVLAAGIPRAFDGTDFEVITYGYVIIRLGMVGHWLRAACSDAGHRRAALRYAAAITIVQAGWVALLLVPESLRLPGFGLLVIAELLVPVWAEQASPTSWHPSHIAERYGLFTIIVLGESILAATIAFQTALDAGEGDLGLVSLAVASLLIVLSMWWLYFDHPSEHRLTSLARSFVWGYGHLVVFATAAAVGAGLAVAVDYETHLAHINRLETGLATAVPISLYLCCIWSLHLFQARHTLLSLALPAGAVLVLLTPLTGIAVQLEAVILVALTVLTVLPHQHAHIGDSEL